jgi:hypothetical protein
MTIYKLEAQIAAIEKNIANGKCKNIFAAKCKVKKLRYNVTLLKNYANLAR